MYAVSIINWLLNKVSQITGDKFLNNILQFHLKQDHQTINIRNITVLYCLNDFMSLVIIFN